MWRNRPVFIHCCKDRTLSYRTRDEPIFNGVALVVFAVNSKQEAQDLITLVGCVQYTEHPQLPGQRWHKINIGTKRYLELDDLDAVTEKLEAAYKLLKKA